MSFCWFCHVAARLCYETRSWSFNLHAQRLEYYALLRPDTGGRFTSILYKANNFLLAFLPIKPILKGSNLKGKNLLQFAFRLNPFFRRKLKLFWNSFLQWKCTHATRPQQKSIDDACSNHICGQRKPRPACTCMQSDQGLRYPLLPVE